MDFISLLQSQEKLVVQTEKAPFNFIFAIFINKTPINLIFLVIAGVVLYVDGLSGFTSMNLSTIEVVVLSISIPIGVFANYFWLREFFKHHLAVTSHRIIFSDMGKIKSIDFNLLQSFRLEPRLTGTRVSIKLTDDSVIQIDDVMNASADALIIALQQIRDQNKQAFLPIA